MRYLYLLAYLASNIYCVRYKNKLRFFIIVFLGNTSSAIYKSPSIAYQIALLCFLHRFQL